MGLKIETWSIAYRIKKEGLLFNDNSGFKLINNGRKGWYADPFLFDYEDKTYLFAEYFSYSLGRGVLGYRLYNEKKKQFGKFVEVIREDYHLSYPYVFQDVYGNIFILPESYSSNELYLYKARRFPDEWEKYKIIKKDIKVVDTTPFNNNGKQYAFSLDIAVHKQEKLLLIEFNGFFEFKSSSVLSYDMSIARPGGRIISHNNKTILVSQDCDGEYGKALNFIEFSITNNKELKYKLIKKVLPSDIVLVNGGQASGIHTYNSSKKMEVIDLKYYKYSYYRLLKKIFSINGKFK